MKNAKLPWRIKIGYGLCTAGDVVPYELFYVYFLFFLTDIIGIAPALAGLVLFIALLWDTVTDPFSGKLSDDYVSPKGKRIPWMKAGILPLALSVFLLFAPFQIGSGVAQVLYYIFAAMLMMLFYDVFVVPYFALGAELTADYGERNILRTLTMVAYYPLMIFASAGPMLIWSIAGDLGYTDRQAWAIIGAALAILMLIICCVGLFLLRNCEKDSLKAVLEAKKTKVQKNFLKIWAACLKIKSFRKIIVCTLVFLLGYSMLYTVLVYFMTHNIGMSEDQQSIFWVFCVAVSFFTLPAMAFFCNKFGKRNVLLLVMAPSTVTAFILFFTGINSLAVLYCYAFLFSIASSAFFTFYLGFAYDCVEIDEFLTGVRKEGSMTALTSFAQKLGSSVAMLCAGLFLEFRGYDGQAAVQSEAALHGIHTMMTLVPAIMYAAAIAVLATYPVSKQKFELLCAALAKKRAGEAYSSEGFADIL